MSDDNLNYVILLHCIVLYKAYDKYESVSRKSLALSKKTWASATWHTWNL